MNGFAWCYFSLLIGAPFHPIYKCFFGGPPCSWTIRSSVEGLKMTPYIVNSFERKEADGLEEKTPHLRSYSHGTV